jgi:hypothetical protein
MPTKIPIQAIIDALINHHGLVSLAAAEIGCSPRTIQRRLSDDRRVKDAQEDAQGHLLDIAEDKLAQGVVAGEWEKVKYFLSTKGKSRGYISSQEVVIKKPEVNEFDDMTDEEVRYRWM